MSISSMDEVGPSYEGIITDAPTRPTGLYVRVSSRGSVAWVGRHGAVMPAFAIDLSVVCCPVVHGGARSS